MKAPIIDGIMQFLKEVFSYAEAREKNLSKRQLIYQNKRLRKAVDLAEYYILTNEGNLNAKKKKALLRKYKIAFFKYNQ